MPVVLAGFFGYLQRCPVWGLEKAKDKTPLGRWGLPGGCLSDNEVLSSGAGAVDCEEVSQEY